MKKLTFFLALFSSVSLAQDNYKYNSIDVSKTSTVYAKQIGVGHSEAVFKQNSVYSLSGSTSGYTANSGLSVSNNIISYASSTSPTSYVMSFGEGKVNMLSKSGFSVNDGGFWSGVLSQSDIGVFNPDNSLTYRIQSDKGQGINFKMTGSSTNSISIDRPTMKKTVDTNSYSIINGSTIMLDNIPLMESSAVGSFGITNINSGGSNDR